MLNDDDELVLESLLLRYLDGRCTAAERATIERNPAWRQRATNLAREEARVQQRFQARAPGAAPPPDEVVAFVAGTLADPRQAQLAQRATTDPQVAAEIALLRALGPNPLLPPETVPSLADPHPQAARPDARMLHPAHQPPTSHPHWWRALWHGRLVVAAVVAASSLLVLIGFGVSGGLDWARDYLMPDSDPGIVAEVTPRPATPPPATATGVAPAIIAEAPSSRPADAAAPAAETAEAGLGAAETAEAAPSAAETLAWELGVVEAEALGGAPPGSPGAEEAGPAPSGSLHLVRSTNTITLTVTHLPALPPGQVYQLWFLYDDHPDGDHPLRFASMATFTVDPQGGAERQIHPPQPVVVPKHIVITNEPSGGSAHPTGSFILQRVPR